MVDFSFMTIPRAITLFCDGLASVWLFKDREAEPGDRVSTWSIAISVQG